MMEKTKSRWILSLVIVGVVLVASIVLILTGRAPSESIVLKASSDGSRGAFTAWYQNQGIHVQRLGPDGTFLWSEEVVLENSRLQEPTHFTLSEDGQGGVIISWGDTSGKSDDREDPSFYAPVPVYSQRLNAFGEPLWGKGSPTGSGELYGLTLTLPRLVPDDNGGVYVLWNDFKTAYRGLHDDYFRLQKINSQGQPVWEEPGKLLFASTPYHLTTPEEETQGEKGIVNRPWPIWNNCEMVSDGQGGIIVVWEEETQNRYTNISAQRYTANGELVWEDGGVLVYSGWDAFVQTTADGDGGVIFVIGAGGEQPTGLSTYYVQRITSEGRLLWLDAGLLIKNNFQPWGNIEAIPEDTDTIILWQETTGKPEIIDDSPVYQIALYAESINAEGNIIWQRTPLFTSQAGKNFSYLVTYKSGEEVLLAWRLVSRGEEGGRVFTQKMSAIDGELIWGERGVAVFGEELQYQGPPVLVSDGSGGVIILVVAGQNPLNGDTVYAQRQDAACNALWGEGIKVSQ